MLAINADDFERIKIIAGAVGSTIAVLKYTGKLKNWTGEKLSTWVGEEIDRRLEHHTKKSNDTIVQMIDSRLDSRLKSEDFQRALRHGVRNALMSFMEMCPKCMNFRASTETIGSDLTSEMFREVESDKRDNPTV